MVIENNLCWLWLVRCCNQWNCLARASFANRVQVLWRLDEGGKEGVKNKDGGVMIFLLEGMFLSRDQYLFLEGDDFLLF
ncbi:hypothetical protein PUP66_08570 [Pseudomonas chlororaphis]|uniref:hypothetical protein n=1 Tax=Pseudomonas chlororaphis TaxID=587753 RepID=UPI000F54D313|nr:hypothetical protein [Pseudomonas chlororaphis]WDH48911.1 hypothetical protein PUP66_08570 [Pseudomonas chlororaphis]WDH60761.1 hypothetical protein PUP56_08570 [Pseudomonas chlororaphis]WQE20016.1 hypothetical protein U0007_07380 [Pseudomonas chlororaphis]